MENKLFKNFLTRLFFLNTYGKITHLKCVIIINERNRKKGFTKGSEKEKKATIREHTEACYNYTGCPILKFPLDYLFRKAFSEKMF